MQHQANMLLSILILNLVLSLTWADAKSSPKQGLEDLVENLEFRLRDVETRLESKEKEMEALEDKMKEEKDASEKREMELKASMSQLRMEVEESANFSNTALANPSLRDLPIVLISAWHSGTLTSPQTVTFDSFLTNFNNQDRPGGGSGVLDLDSGVFTCFTSGYYTVSFSAYGGVGPSHSNPHLFLFKNGSQLPESEWYIATSNGGIYDDIGVTSSRILVTSCKHFE